MRYFLLILTFAVAIHAQSIDSLLNMAEKHHPALQAVKAKIEAARAKAKAVDIYPAPTVALEIAQIPYGTWDIINDANMNTLTISQMFMPDGKVKAMVKAEESQVAVLEEQYQALLRQFKARIVTHYLKIWEIEQKQQLLGEEAQLLTKMENLLTSKLISGDQNSGELLLLKLQKSENASKLLNLDNDRQTQLFMLTKTAVIHDGDLRSYQFKLPAADSLTVSLAELQSAVQRNPDLRAMDKMADMINLEQVAKNKDQIPDFMLSAMFMRMPKGMFVTENMAMEMGPEMHDPPTGSAYMYGLMLSFNLPFIWWHNDQFTYQKKSAGFEQESTLLSRTNMEYQMSNEVSEMYLKQQSAWRNIQFFRQNTVDAYNSVITNQIEQLSSGKGDMKMILEMEKMLLMQKMNYIMSQGEFYMLLNDLEKMSGMQLVNLK